MNQYLKKFITEKFQKPGKALDLGAGKFLDVEGLKQSGWDCVGVDLRLGIDLEHNYLSKDGPFDLVYANYVIHKIKNKKQFIQTVYDNLKEGGWFFLHTFDKSDINSSSNISSDVLQELLGAKMFQKVDVKQFDYFDDEDGHKHWHKILEAVGQKITMPPT